MNRIAAKTGMTLLGVASAALVALPIEGRAQSGLEDQRLSLAALGAAIDEVKRSPFHRVGQGGPGVNPRIAVSAVWPLQGAGTRVTGGPGSTGTLPQFWASPPGVVQETSRGGTAPGLSGVRVFLTTSVTAALSDAAAYALALSGAYSPRGSGGEFLIAGGVAAMAIGPALGGKLAGGRFFPGLLGSVSGVGLGGLLAGGVIGDERGVPEAMLFSLFVLMHAGTTTLFVVKAEEYAADGRDG